jgi:hypothetical protein
MGLPAGSLEHEPEQVVAEVRVQPRSFRGGGRLAQALLRALEAEPGIRIGWVDRAQVHGGRQPRQPGGVRRELPA